MEEDLDDYFNNPDSSMALLRKFFDINQNVSLFIIGILVIKIYSYFGDRYNGGLVVERFEKTA